MCGEQRAHTQYYLCCIKAAKEDDIDEFDVSVDMRKKKNHHYRCAGRQKLIVALGGLAKLVPRSPVESG